MFRLKSAEMFHADDCDIIEICFLCSTTDVAHEDSGNYTCEVRGPHSIVLRRVTHSLYVRSKYSLSRSVQRTIHTALTAFELRYKTRANRESKNNGCKGYNVE